MSRMPIHFHEDTAASGCRVAGGKARSAGAWIRRQNTVALRDEIHAVLAQWQSQSSDCQRIFIAASKRTVSTLWCDALSKDDARIRKVPFTTFRPTFAEAAAVSTRHKNAWLPAVD